MKAADQFALCWFATLNLAAFVAFAFDKWRAGRPGRRVPEFQLVMLGALGGWPSGILGMILFRHKTAKWSFKLKYALGLIGFAAELWAWQRWR